MYVLSCWPPQWGFALLKIFPVFLIGLIAAGIAWRQHQTAKAKLKLDLFEKRYAIFEDTWQFLSHVFRTGRAPSLFPDFNNKIPQADFLFGNAVSRYLEEAVKKNADLYNINLRTDSNNNILMPEDITLYRDLLLWFHEQATGGAKNVFEPFLGFEKWR
jgi:hypothetical protein